MSTAQSRHGIRRQLESYRRSPGNWRLKGLLLSLADGVDPADVGRAWPQARPRSPSDFVNLGYRHDDTHEHTIARELYGQDAITAAEQVPRDQYIARALVSSAQTEKDVLWREEMLATIQAGAATRRIARDTTTVTVVEAKRGDLTAHEQVPFANPAAEGANPEFDEESYAQVPYNCTKFEQGFQITEELIQAAEIDQIERQIEAAGMAVENAINRQYVTNCIDNAGNTVSGVGNEASVQTILEAVEFPADSDFDPVDVAVIHHELMTELADDPALNYLNFSRRGRELQAGDEEVFDVVAAGPEIFIASDATYNGAPATANTYGWEAGSEVGGFVHGREFVHTVVYRDVQVSELDTPYTALHDVQGGVASAYTDSVQPSNNAIASISQ